MGYKERKREKENQQNFSEKRNPIAVHSQPEPLARAENERCTARRGDEVFARRRTRELIYKDLINAWKRMRPWPGNVEQQGGTQREFKLSC